MPFVRRPVCVIVPCFNEAARLQVDQIRGWLALGCDTRLLFVDDGSRDGTLALLRLLETGEEGRISVLGLSRNVGKAEAVRRGILHALDTLHPELVGFWDADLATPLSAIREFCQVLAARPDIEMVFGARVKLLGRRVERRPMRHYLGRVFATVVSNSLRLPIYDTQCGAKIFRVSPLTRGIFAEPFLSRWVFDVEIIARYLQREGGDPRKLEKAIYEYPLEAWVDVAGSKVRPIDFLVAFLDVLRIRQRYLT